MELRHIRYFVAVAEELHFGRAARRVRVSQPPLSRQIADLERELGVKLLIRSSHRVELTAPGVAFLNDSREILAAIERAKATARTVNTQPAGPLRIGFVKAIGWPLKSSVIREVIGRYPRITPTLEPGSTAEQLRALRSRQLDVAVIWETAPHSKRHADLDRLVLRKDPIDLAVPPGHPLARRRHVSMEHLATQVLITSHRSENPDAHDALITTLKRHRVSPQLLYSDGSGIADLVAAGLGVCFISAASPHRGRSDIAIRPFHPPFMLAAMTMVWLRDNMLPALRGFLEVLTELNRAGQLT
jgi:DNA-binding transcriptional LysR family regulator